MTPCILHTGRLSYDGYGLVGHGARGALIDQTEWSKVDQVLCILGSIAGASR